MDCEEWRGSENKENEKEGERREGKNGRDNGRKGKGEAFSRSLTAVVEVQTSKGR